MSTAAAPPSHPPLYSPGRKIYASLEALEEDQGICWNPHRAALLADLKKFINLLRNRIGICAVWIGGSFLTEKEEPSDIDVTLILDGKVVYEIPAESTGLRLLVTNYGLRKLVERKGLRIDAYTITWNPHVEGEQTPRQKSYLNSRGYWDDWWQRQRQGDDNAPKDRSWAVPRQGYVEVIINGYEQG